MTNPLDDLIAGAAAEVVTRPQDREPESLTLGEGDAAIEVTETSLEAELAGLESVLTSPEFLQLLDLLAGLDVSAGNAAQGGHIGQWLESMDTTVDSIREDATTLASLIRDELIPAVATMRGTLTEVQNARAATAPPASPLLPGQHNNAAFEQLRRVQASQGAYAPGQSGPAAWGLDPQQDLQRAYATIAGMPSAMDHLVTGNYAAPTTTTSSGGTAAYQIAPAASTQVTAGGATAYAPGVSAPAPTAQAAGAPVPAAGAAPAPRLSPAARALAGAGAIAHGVSKGLRGETGSSKTKATPSGTSRGMTRAEVERAAKDAARKLDKSGARAGTAGGGGKTGGVSKSELMKMIEDAKKRIASERKPGQQTARRGPRVKRPTTSTLDAMRKDKDGGGDGPGSPKFLDVATTTPGVARPDSETSGSKPTPAASGGAAGGGGGRGMGMGMMPMGGMMGAMNRMGQGGPGGPGGPGGSGGVEVPTDYNLEEVGKKSVDSVAGGVIRDMGPVPEDDDLVSPIQRGVAEESEDGEDKPKKRGLGNIFG